MKSRYLASWIGLACVSACLESTTIPPDYSATYDAIISVDSQWVCASEPGCNTHVLQKLPVPRLIHATFRTWTKTVAGHLYPQIDVSDVSCPDGTSCENGSFLGFIPATAHGSPSQDSIVTFGTDREPRLVLTMRWSDPMSAPSEAHPAGSAIWQDKIFYPRETYYGAFTATRR
jgi:hypothetical protein